jgi:drug/metabolite transporter (DMT)-like permease
MAFLAIALIGNVIPFLLIAWGIRHIPSGLSGILMAVMPLGVALLAHFFLSDEPLTWKKSAGFLLGFAGVVVLLGPQRIAGLGSHGLAFWGEIAMIAAALCYSIQSIITRRIKSKGSLEPAAAGLSIAAVFGLALALLGDPAGLSGATGKSLLALLVLGLLNTALATVAFFHLIRLAGAGFASMINYLIPVFAVLVGWLFLDERLAQAAFAGLALILAGIGIVQSRRSR